MEMLLVNPRKRRKKAKGRKRRAVSRRRRRSSGGKRRAAAGYVVGNAPIRRRKLNPRRRKRRGRSRRRSFRRRRNPTSAISLRSFAPGNLMGQVTGALPGAFGALGLDVALGFLPIPVTWKAGIPGYLTKIVGAVALGMVAGKLVGGGTAAKMTTGALTVMFHGILRELVATNLPGVPLGMYLQPGGLGYAGSGYNPSGGGMGLYLPDISSDDMGMDQRDLGMYVDNYGTGDFYG